MPIYEFRCRACGRQFEELVRVGGSSECPSCGSGDLERLVSMPAVSTTRSRERSLSTARRTASKLRQEKNHAQAEYERNYIKDHS